MFHPMPQVGLYRLKVAFDPLQERLRNLSGTTHCEKRVNRKFGYWAFFLDW